MRLEMCGQIFPLEIFMVVDTMPSRERDAGSLLCRLDDTIGAS